jgi:F-type H+-transporting ATPase subunit a
MALDLLTGAVQAYIFSVLAMVFIAGVLGDDQNKKPAPQLKAETSTS